MSILVDHEIEARCSQGDLVIAPFFNKPVSHEDGNGVISYGLSSAGYDVRLANEFSVVRPCLSIENAPLDPKNVDPDHYHTVVTDEPIELEPGGFMLGRTMEYFEIPRGILVTCIGKSTYARVGVILNVTPIEPGFKGEVVIEIQNQTKRPVLIYPNEGICQFLFNEAKVECAVSYQDKGGKYQNQRGITHAKV